MQFHAINFHYFLADTRSQSIANANGTIIGGTADGTAAGLDIAGLGPVVQELFSSGLAKSTQKSYKSGTARYTNFCMKFEELTFLATARVVCCFVARLFLDGVAGSSIKTYLAAIRHYQIAPTLRCRHDHGFIM